MKVLVVDDDRVLADLLVFTFRREGFEVLQAGDGDTALRLWAEHQPDIVILDVNLPSAASNLDGFGVCKRIRAISDTPVILLTVRSNEEDILNGLKLGADDYVQKPFSPRQLVARVQVVLRRSGKSAQPTERRVGGLVLDANRRTVTTDGAEPVLLTPLEYRLLETLMINAGQVLPFDEIIQRVWGAEGGDRDMLRQLVRRLRSKIEPDPSRPKFIETIPALGYGLKKI